MSHYYDTDNTLSNTKNQLNFKVKNTSLRFFTMAGIFSKNGLDFGTKLMLENIEILEYMHNVADVGCGYGVVGIYLAKQKTDMHIFMYDINERAVELSSENAVLNQVTNVTVEKSNALKEVKQTFDLIVSNPPIRAGKDVVFEIYEQAYDKLNVNGYLYIVIQKKQGAASTIKKIDELFNNSKIVIKKSGYFVIKAKKQ